jgi:hypothetical protein
MIIGHSSAIIFRTRHHNGCLSRRRPREHRPQQRPHLSCQPPQLLPDADPPKRTEARSAPSTVVLATTVAACANADQTNIFQISALTCRFRHPSSWLSHAYEANRGKISALTFRVRHPSGWLSPRLPSEQGPEPCPHLSCPPPQWLGEHTPNKQSEIKVAPSSVVPATTVSA